MSDVPLQFGLEAVVAHFRENAGVWLEPGHIWARWRDYRRELLAREDDAAREARQAALDARLPELEELIEAKGLPGPSRFERRKPDPALAVECPWCHARPGKGCEVPQVRTPIKGFHPSRVELASAQPTEGAVTA